MSLTKKFKTDPRHETEGVCLDYGDGVKIWVARAGGSNKRFLKEAERLNRKHRRQIQLNVLDNDTQLAIAQELYAKTVVLKWEGVTQEDIGGKGDEPAPFTVENCVALFSNLPDLFSDVTAQAMNSDLFRETIREADAGN